MFEIFVSIWNNALQSVGGLFSFLFGNFFFILLPLLILFAVWQLWKVYLKTIRKDFLSNQKWIYVSMRVLKVDELSTPALERVFFQLHSLLREIDVMQKYVEGQVPLWYSLEMVSLGGNLSFVARIPLDSKDLLLSAIYAQYPEAEITVIEDYLQRLSGSSLHAGLEVWGGELLLEKNQALPIKTYGDFEKLKSGKKFRSDPIKPLLEGLVAVKPNELFTIQILARPVADSDWKPAGEEKANELVSGKSGGQNQSVFPFSFLKIFRRAEKKSPASRDFSALSDVEKDRVNAVLKKLGKPGYECLVRILYLAMNESYDKTKPNTLLSAFGSCANSETNSFKLNSATVPQVSHRLSSSLERPYISHLSVKRKKLLLEKFVSRSFGGDTKPYVLNSEELATIYHFPQTLQPVEEENVQEVVVKGQPPEDLPVGEY